MNVVRYFSTYLQILNFLYVISFFTLANDFVYMIKQSLKNLSLYHYVLDFSQIKLLQIFL